MMCTVFSARLPPTHHTHTHHTHTHSTHTTHTEPFFIQTLLPEYQLTAGDNLTLVCIGENTEGAVSELFILWRFGFTPLNVSDRRITTMTIGSNQLLSQLQILNIPSSYHGEFACDFSNRLPFESRNAVSNSANVVVFCEFP